MYEPMVNKNQKGNLTTQTKLNEQLLKAISLNSEGQHQQTTSLNVDIGFTTEIPRLSENEVIENVTNTIHLQCQCYTDGSKMNEKVGAGVYIVQYWCHSQLPHTQRVGEFLW